MFSALRVFALWERSVILATVVLILGLAPVGADLVSKQRFHIIGAVLIGCGVKVSMDKLHVYV